MEVTLSAVEVAGAENAGVEGPRGERLSSEDPRKAGAESSRVVSASQGLPVGF